MAIALILDENRKHKERLKTKEILNSAVALLEPLLKNNKNTTNT